MKDLLLGLVLAISWVVATVVVSPLLPAHSILGGPMPETEVGRVRDWSEVEKVAKERRKLHEEMTANKTLSLRQLLGDIVGRTPFVPFLAILFAASVRAKRPILSQFLLVAPSFLFLIAYLADVSTAIAVALTPLSVRLCVRQVSRDG